MSVATMHPQRGAGGGRAAWLAWAALPTAAAVGALGARHLVVFGVVAVFAAGLAICALARARPAVALTGAFFLLPVAATKFRGRSATASMAGEVDAQIVFELGLYALMGLMSVSVVTSREFAWRRLGRAELLLALYALTAVSSGLWSYSPLVTIVKGTQLTILLLLCVVAARVMDAGSVLDGATKVIAPYVLICALLAVLFPWAANHASTGSPVERFGWFYVHPIAAASYAAVALLSIYIRARYPLLATRLKSIPRLALVAIPLLVILVATRARGPALAMVIAIGLLVVRAHIPAWLMGVLVAALLVLVAVYVNSGTSWIEWLAARSDDPLTRFLLRGQEAADVADFSGRAELWRGATKMFVARPLIGYGYGGAARGLLLEALPWAGDAHNGMMQTLLDVGLVGSLPLCVALIRAFVTTALARWRTIYRMDYARAAVLGFLAFVLVNSVTDVGFAEPGYLFVLTASCVIAAERMRVIALPRAAV